MLRAQFGTFRGLVRLCLAYVQCWTGRAAILPGDPARITRLVFVCHGNICRSAFADSASKRLGLATASFGLSTMADKPAHAPAMEAAAAMGHDLSSHRTMRVEDYIPQSGDLLLAMEVRQLHRLAALPGLADVPRSLLGLWCKPAFPHLHDPYMLDSRYMPVCLKRIETAAVNLARAFPGARLS